MKIEISSGGKDDPRTVKVTGEEMEPFEFKAENLSDAHKLIKQGRNDGWDTLKTAKPKGK
jgi:hypothetical protein